MERNLKKTSFDNVAKVTDEKCVSEDALVGENLISVKRFPKKLSFYMEAMK